MISYQKISGSSETKLDFYANAHSDFIDKGNNYITSYESHSSDGVNFDEYTSSLKSNTVFNRQYCLVNIHSTDSVSVDLYIKYISSIGNTTLGEYDSSAPEEGDAVYATIYYLKSVVIPNGASLKLEKDDLRYPLKYRDVPVYLYIKLNAGDSAVDVITTEY